MFLFDLICHGRKNGSGLVIPAKAGISLILFFLSSCYDIGDRDNPLDPGANNFIGYDEPGDESSSSIQKAESSSSKKSSSSSTKTTSSSTLVSSSSRSGTIGSSNSSKQSSSSVIPDSAFSSNSKSSSSKNVIQSSSEITVSSSSKNDIQSYSSMNVISSSSTNTTSSSWSVAIESSNSTKQSSSSVIPEGACTELAECVPGSASSSNSKSSSSKNVVQSSSAKAISSSSTKTTSSSTLVSSSSCSGAIGSSSSKLNEITSSSEDSWTCGVNSLVRDGVEYKTVVIKEKCFTKENMRYVPKAGGNTMCYENKDANCKTYGLLYDFDAASLACPTGWRLPTSAEYIELQDYSGDDMYDAGTHFKATFGWTNENGDDFLEFSALPGGYCDDEGCYGIGSMGYWWTSTEKVKNASHLTLFLNGDGGAFSAEKKMDNDKFASVRCVKTQK